MLKVGSYWVGSLTNFSVGHVSRPVIRSPRRPARLPVCSAACAVLASEGQAPPVAVAAALLSASDEPWARYFAAEALAGPWAADTVAELEAALADDEVLTDLWSLMRVSDVAARALLSLPPSRKSEALRNWFFRLKADLQSPRLDVHDAATYALAQLGDDSAVAHVRAFSPGVDCGRPSTRPAVRLIRT